VIERFHSDGRMSQAVKANGFIFTAGQVAEDPVPSAAEQSRQILEQIDRLLADAGTDKRSLVSASIWLSDIRYFDEMNSVWDDWVADGAPPCRATVACPLAGPEYWVEIAVVAAA